MIESKNKGKTNEYVYDISLDGTVVNALGLNVCSNTDGFNFKLPDTFRYTVEKPYISTGESRETKKGEAYTGFKGDVAEFNDTYMKDFHYSPDGVNKMGLGIDEVVSATINFARKNYADYFPEKPFPEDVKLVGNTIKSKKMPGYIKNFLEVGVRLLLHNKGKEFLDEYYKYIEKIYNYQIPLRDIASKGKVKKTINAYNKDCETITKAGNPKARQAWMELAIKNNLSVNLGETIYYINTGKSKSQADIKRVTHYYKVNSGLFGEEKKDVKVQMEKEWKKDNIEGKPTGIKLKEYVTKKYPDVKIEDEIILNCELVPREIIESDTDYFCEDGKEYNVAKYISQFNKRITPLLVCFDKEIRSQILIDNPKNKPYFTEEQCALSHGQPNKPGDQDTYEQIMTMDDREIKFWMNHPEWKIPFLKECNTNWEETKSNYLRRKEKEKELGIDKVREDFDNIMQSLTDEDFDNIEEGEIPSKILSLVDIDGETGNLVSKEYPDIVIATIADLVEYRYNMAKEDNNNE